MTHHMERHPLFSTCPGTTRSLILHRFGMPGARPKAYAQAALHADETPGLLVTHHLIALLNQAEAEGAIRGEIVVAPYANPIGLSQFVNETQMGRHELGGGGNFNRNWPDLIAPVAENVAGKLNGDPAHNVACIRAAMLETIKERPPKNELQSLRKLLAENAADADIVLDLHCDDEALMHMFLSPIHWPDASGLAAELGCHAVLLAEESGGSSFDEAFSVPWIRLAERFPDHPIPAACVSSTVELRGYSDVADSLATDDAKALFRFFQKQGLIDGDPGALPEPLCDATRLDACDVVTAPCAGVLSYAVELGARIKKGDIVAWLIDPAAPPSAENPAKGRQAIHSRADGLVLSRRSHKYVAPGDSVAKIVGVEPLAHRVGGYLLED